MQTRRFLEPVALARHLLPQVTSMYFPGGWVDGCPQAAGGGDAPPQPDSLSLDNNNPQRLKVGIVPREYHRTEKLSLEFWDHRRLAEHVLAVMPLDSGRAAVEFILTDYIAGSFLLNYAHEVDEMLSGSKCEVARRIAKVIPSNFCIPRRKARFAGGGYSLPELVQELNAGFNLCNHSLAADEFKEDFDWEETPPPSALASDSERRLDSKSDPIEGARRILSLVEHARQAQVETSSPLSITLPQTSLGQDIFTCPALSQMGFLHDFPSTPECGELSQHALQMSTTCTTQSLTPTCPADVSGRPSGSKERMSGRRSGRTSATVVPGSRFLCFGAGMLAPFRNLSKRLLIPRTFTFSAREPVPNIKERRPGHAEVVNQMLSSCQSVC